MAGSGGHPVPLASAKNLGDTEYRIIRVADDDDCFW
jgi:hypothetical protein